MKKRQLYIKEIPAVSHDFARAIDQRFPRQEVKPGVTQDELLYNAGQRSVVEFILSVASGTKVSGSISDVKPEKHTRSFLDVLLGAL